MVMTPPTMVVAAVPTVKLDAASVDDDGAVVIPKDLIEFVAHEGAEHELYESWVFTDVEKGAQLPGLYPPNEESKARYQQWRHSLD